MSTKCRKSLALAAAAAFALAAGSAHATTETINLDAAPAGSFSQLTVDGFNLNWIGYGNQQTVASVGGQNVLQNSVANSSIGAEITISRVDGGVFSLLSADIAALSGNHGYRIDLGSGSYNAIPSTFETVNPDGTTNVTGVTLDIVDGGSGYAVKNLVVSFAAVPEPSSLALFGAPLLVVGAVAARRRRAG